MVHELIQHAMDTLGRLAFDLRKVHGDREVEGAAKIVDGMTYEFHRQMNNTFGVQIPIHPPEYYREQDEAAQAVASAPAPEPKKK